MIIKGLSEQLKLYKKVNNSSNEVLAGLLDVSPKTIQRTIDDSSVKSLDFFVHISKLLKTEYEVKNGVLTQLINNVKYNSGTVQNVVNQDTVTTSQLQSENDLLKARIKDLETIIELLKQKR